MKIRLRRKKRRGASSLQPAPPAIFDAEFYRRKYKDIANYPDLWGHYCEYGFREDRDPNPVFSTHYYRRRYLEHEPEINPVVHYLESDDKLLNTHPLFDASFYASQLQQMPIDQSLLEHFLKYNVDNRLSPSPFFDSVAYLECYTDIEKCRMNPLYHFLRHGVTERRQTFVDLNHLDVIRFRDPHDIELLRQYLDPELDFIVHLLQMDRSSPTVICVSHEASLTGAPLIILKIAEALRRDFDVNVVNLLCNGGDILPKFEALGPTFSLQGSGPHRHAFNFRSAMNFFVRSLSVMNVVGCFVNSAESRHVVEHLSRLNSPIHTLIHENARCYGEFREEPFADVQNFSDRVIFPSTYVFDAAMDGSGVTKEKARVIPQGLLREEMLDPVDQETSGRLRAEYDIPADARLVLGCGTGDSRKGLDLFIATAISVINRDPTKKIYFGWLGNLDVSTNVSNSFWAKMDVETAQLTDRVVFFDQQTEVRDFFDASDLFFLTSRMDPFPCVVNEAMARGKPIALFDDASGCVELVTGDGGAVIPYGDICSACDAILELANDDARREAAGERNRQYVEQNMQFDDYVGRLVDGLVQDMQLPRYDLLDNQSIKPLFQKSKSPRRTEKKRVFFLAPSWSVSGVNTFAENLGLELNNRGYEAGVLLTSPDSKSLPKEFLPKIPHQFLLSGWAENDKKNERLLEFLKTMAPAIVIPNCDYSSSPIATGLPEDIRCVGVLHSDDSEHYVHGYRMGHYWDEIVAVSQTIRTRLLDMNPAFADKTRVIRCGINPPDELENRVNQQATCDELRIIYTGRISQHQKRIFDFVELMSELQQREVPFTMTFVGTGPDQKEFEKRASTFIRQGRARVLGRLNSNEIYTELSQHHVFCLLSDFEGLPISLLEALATGCVPIVTAVESGIDEILRHDQNSLMSPLRNVSAMADQMQNLFNDNKLRRRLALAASATLDDHQCTTGQMADQYEALFDRIFSDIRHGRQTTEMPLHCPRVSGLLEGIVSDEKVDKAA